MAKAWLTENRGDPSERRPGQSTAMAGSSKGSLKHSALLRDLEDMEGEWLVAVEKQDLETKEHKTSGEGRQQEATGTQNMCLDLHWRRTCNRACGTLLSDGNLTGGHPRALNLQLSTAFPF